MLTTLVAVLGTLAGAALTGWLRVFTDQRQHAVEQAEARREQIITAVTDLVTALAAHRLAMWVREEARLTSAPADTIAVLREASHETRGAVTAPAVRLQVLAPALTSAAQAAEQATHQMRDAADLTALGARRADALAAAQALTAQAAAVLA